MKKTDVAMIVLIAGICALVAFLVAGRMPFLKGDSRGVKVPTVEKITSEVASPDEVIFNKDAINPTVQTIIGTGSDAPQ